MSRERMDKKKKIIYDLSAVRENADCVEVAWRLGLEPVEKKGKTYSPVEAEDQDGRNHTYMMLCPNPEHNDTHLGSCYLNTSGMKGYVCYACGAKKDLFDMVKEARRCDFRSAVEFILGENNLEGFAQDEKKSVEMIIPPAERLSEEERKLLGLSIRSHNKAVYYKNECYERDITLPENRKTVPSPTNYGDVKKDTFMVVEQSGFSDPLLELQAEEPEVYHWLVAQKAQEQIDWYNDIIHELKFLTPKTFGEALAKQIMALGGDRLDLVKAMQNRLEMLKQILLEHTQEAVAV